MGNTTSSSSSPMLELTPAVVRDKILLFVSSGEGGIRDFLNLRSVCPTTKLWVDRLPKKQADVVFSRAKIRVELRSEPLRQFLESPPPFKVTTLSIKAEERPFNYVRKETWTSFYIYWIMNLETLELLPHNLSSSAYNPLVLDLMQSPNLHTISILGEYFLLPEGSKISWCFEKVTSLDARSILPRDPRKSKFYSQIQSNRNLRRLTMDIHAIEDLEGVTNLIDLRKEDTELQMNFRLHQPTLFMNALEQEDLNYQLVRQAFRNFAHSIVASNSKIRLLDVHRLGYFKDLMEQLLPRDAYQQLFTMVESSFIWIPTNESLSLPKYFPRLKRLSWVDTSYTSANYDRLTFPPSLKDLRFFNGFAPLVCLPPNLTILHWNQIKLGSGSLRSSLSLIRSCCPSLTALWIGNWESGAEESRGSAADFETSPPFSKLKELSFDTKFQNEDDAEDNRTALLNEFDWPNLKLRVLKLSFRDSNWRELPLVGEEILKDLLNGPSAKSLRTLKMPKGSVASEALTLREKLMSLPSVTCENF